MKDAKGNSVKALLIGAVAAVVDMPALATNDQTLACEPSPGQMAVQTLVAGPFRRITGELVLREQGREEIPVIAVQSITNGPPYRRASLVFRNEIPQAPDGARSPVFGLSFDQDEDDGPAPAQRARDYVWLGAPVRFAFEQRSARNFAFRVEFSLPDGTADAAEGDMDVEPFETRDVSIVCAGAGFEVRNLRIEQ